MHRERVDRHETGRAARRVLEGKVDLAVPQRVELAGEALAAEGGGTPRRHEQP